MDSADDFETTFASWADDCDEDVGDTPASAASASVEAAPKKKRGPGRPKGSTGSRFIRQELQALAAANAEGQDDAPAEEAPDVMHQLAQLRQHREEGTRLTDLFGPAKFILNVGSAFQRVVSGALRSSIELLTRTKANQVLLENGLGEPEREGALAHIVQGRALTCSATALAAMSKGAEVKNLSSRSTLRRLMVSAGALALESSALLCSCALSSFIQICKQTPQRIIQMKPLMFCWRVRYDETPSKVRVVNVQNAATTTAPLLSAKTLRLLRLAVTELSFKFLHSCRVP